MKSRPVLIFISVVLLAGCADVISLMLLLDSGRQSKSFEMYCTPDRAFKVKTGKKDSDSSPDWSKRCHWDGIEFKSASNQIYPKTRHEQLMIYKMVYHVQDSDEIVQKDIAPPEHYIELGTYDFPERWYHLATVEDYLLHSIEKMGADAVLEFHAYVNLTRSKLQERKLPIQAYVMRIEARVIRYMD